ncbi:hypothetical protein OIU84_004771, partial [Salix udensis]
MAYNAIFMKAKAICILFVDGCRLTDGDEAAAKEAGSLKHVLLFQSDLRYMEDAKQVVVVRCLGEVK